ncbi:MAG: LamG domain-containing protein [Planctomycetota bacterium]|nr:LamG domain-containing protein [Planctomycetota bacterium]
MLYLPLDEGKGVLVQDRSRFRNNGTINGKPTWESGKRGKALRFHGAKTNAFVDVRPSTSLNRMGAHTLSFWLRWDGQGASWSPLITKRPVDSTNPDQYSTWVRNDGRFDYRNDNGTVFADRNVRLTNEWTFLAVTHDGKDTVTFFIDGVTAGKKKLAKAASNGGPFVIGSGRHLAGDFGAGAIDEVAIFNRNLTVAEIKELREQGPVVPKRAK